MIGGAEAQGICGSGALDAVAVLSGVLMNPVCWRNPVPLVCDFERQSAGSFPAPVHLTQKDIRQIQLAKAALYAGIQTLLETALSNQNRYIIYIAGGFGHYMNLGSAARIGLFRPVCGPRPVSWANAASRSCDPALIHPIWISCRISPAVRRKSPVRQQTF
ncbi:MAG: ASKHA domain-containing protein [Dysosmobacter welbionis]